MEDNRYNTSRPPIEDFLKFDKEKDVGLELMCTAFKYKIANFIRELCTYTLNLEKQLEQYKSKTVVLYLDGKLTRMEPVGEFVVGKNVELYEMAGGDTW